MSSDFPAFCFPTGVKPHQQSREVFGFYGAYSQMHHDTEVGLIPQNLRKNVKFSAAHPVLPLARKSESVKFPVKDRVMGDILQKNRKMKKFILYLKKRQNLYKSKYCFKARDFIIDLQSQAKEQIEATTCDPEGLLTLENTQRIDLRELMEDYIHVKDEEKLQLSNSQYTGGCLGYLGQNDDQQYLISPAGPKFKTINVSQVTEMADNLLGCQTVQQFKFPQSVYGIQCDTIQGQGYAVIRGSSTVQLYSLHSDSSDSILTKIHEKGLDERITSVNMSPYIPGECVLTTAGQCFIWSIDMMHAVFGPMPTRFKVDDLWCSAHFGAHPRQLVYTDQTTVQLKDLRIPFSEAIDLFALPTHLLHQTERIRLCKPYPASSFYHLAATDFTLLLLDERFVKYPVLQLDHMLPMPPQYCDTLHQSESDTNDCLVYIGSQYPADVHGFQFARKDTYPPQQVTIPWRAAKITDISKWDGFVSQCSNPIMLKQRLDGSLAGIQSVPLKNGHAVFQLNCHGEIFHQVFQPSSSSDQDVTFSAGLGSHDLTPLPVAVTRAQGWISSWEKQLFATDKKSVECLSANVEDVFEELSHLQAPDPSCAVCCSQFIEDSQSTQDGDMDENTEICRACGLHLNQGKKLVQEANMSKPSSVWHEVGNFMGELGNPEDLPATTATTKLLLKQWQKDDNIKELLKERDKEVMEIWKVWKNGEKLKKPESPSLLERLSKRISIGRSSERTVDDDSSQDEATELEEELEMMTDTPSIDFQFDDDSSMLEFFSEDSDSSRSKKKKINKKKKGKTKQTVKNSSVESSRQSDGTSDCGSEQASTSRRNNSLPSSVSKNRTNYMSPVTKKNQTSSQAGEVVFKSPDRPAFVRENSVASDISLFVSPSKTRTTSSARHENQDTNTASDSDQSSVLSYSLLSGPSRKKKDKRKRSASLGEVDDSVSYLTQNTPNRSVDASLDMVSPSPKKTFKSSAQKKKMFTAGF